MKKVCIIILLCIFTSCKTHKVLTANERMIKVEQLKNK